MTRCLCCRPKKHLFSKRAYPAFLFQACPYGYIKSIDFIKTQDCFVLVYYYYWNESLMYHSAVATSSPSYLVSPEIFWKNSLYILMGPPSDGCCRYQIDLMMLFCWSGTMITSVLASKIHVKYQKMKQMILLHSVWKVIDFSFIILLCP